MPTTPFKFRFCATVASLLTIFSVNAASASASTVLVDLSNVGGEVTNPAGDGKYWNGIGDIGDVGDSIANLIDSGNSSTGFGLAIDVTNIFASGVSGAGFGGSGVDGPAGADPFDEANVVIDGIFNNNANNGTAVFTFTGLAANTQYNFSAIGGRASNGDDGHIILLDSATPLGTAAITTETAYTLLNNGTVLDFSATSNASGEIFFEFRKENVGDTSGSATINGLRFSAQNVPEDTTPPTLASSAIVDDQSGGPVESGTRITYTVTFSEDIKASTVSSSDFDNAGSSAISFGTIAEISAGVFTLEVTPTSTGTLQLRVLTTATIEDLAGNLLQSDPAILDDTTITVDPDSTPPTLAASDIVDDRAGSSVPVNTPVTYTLTFSEAIDAGTVDAADFANNGTSGMTVGSISETSVGVFTVEVTPTTTGTLQLRIAGDATITDLAGLALATSPAIIDDTALTVEAGATPGVETEELRVGQWIRPSPTSSVLTQAGWHVWGGSVIEENGQYHMFYARWPVAGYAWGDGWLFASEVWHAVADSPGGPFTPTQMILGARSDPPTDTFWDSRGAHNPHIRRFGNKLYLYYTSTRDPGTGTWPGVSERNRLQRTQRIGVIEVDSVQDLLNGNFTRPVSPILEPVTGNSAADDISTNPAPSAIPANRILNNPSVIERPDGKYQLIYKTNWPQAPGFAFGQALADSPAGPFTYVAGALLNDGGQYEDQFHWYDPVLGQYNLVIKRFGTGIDQFVSDDSTNWTLLGKQSDLAVFKADGSYESLDLMERPQVFLGANGRPQALYTAVREDLGGGNFLSYNLQIPLAAPTATATVLDEEVDVLNTGVLVQAVNLGTTTPVTLNGLAFTPAGTDVAALAANYGFIQAGGAAGATLAATTVDAAYEGVAAFEDFLDTVVYQTGAVQPNGTLSFSLDNLEIGADYRLQLFMAESRSSNPRHGPQLLELGGEAAIRFDYGPSSSLVNQGAEAIRLSITFTATGTSMPVTLRNAINDGSGVQLAAFTLHDVSTPPTLAASDIVDDRAGSPVPVNTPVTYTLTFSEAINAGTVDAADFANNGTSGMTVGAISETSPGVFTVEVTPTTLGTLQLRIAGDATITDLAGFALATSPAIVDDTTITVREHRPNIVIFLVDDMGVHDTSVPFLLDGSGQPTRYNFNHFYRTPNMETLAAQGMRFTTAYAQTVCSPTRVGLLTGRTSARHAVTDWVNSNDPGSPANWRIDGMTESEPTLPKELQSAGYRTIHVGKGHLAKSPVTLQGLGFDVNIGGTQYGRPASYTGNYGQGDIRAVPHLEAYHNTGTFLTKALSLEANTAVEDAVNAGLPFFLHMSFYAVHSPFTTNPDATGNYSAAVNNDHAKYATMIEGMDIAIGDIRQKLIDLGVAEDTLIVFIGDNGPDSPATTDNGLPSGSFSDWPMRGKKATKWEGGARIPFIATWAVPDAGNPLQQALPIPANSIETDIVTTWDIPATLLDFVGLPVPADFGEDSHSLLPYFSGTAGTHRPQEIAVHYPHEHRSDFFSWIRQGDMKLIYNFQSNTHELYNLASDPTESTDLAASQPETAMALTRRLAQMLDDEWGPYGVLLPTISTTAPAGNVVSIPNSPEIDLDNDGIDDRDEDPNLNGLVDPGETDPDNDNSDHDNINDGAELRLGTDPLDPGSYFFLRTVALAGGDLGITWPSAPGATFTIRSSSDLTDWSTIVATGIAASAETTTSYNLGNPDAPRLFYRVELD